MNAAPKDTEIEVTVFGPGYGECIIVHVGSGRWLIVDSCKKSPNSRPVALRYLEMIGVDVTSSVELIVLTHWHDDHIRGASELVGTCANAAICISEAFNKEEFKRFLSAFSTTKESKLGTGVDELISIVSAMNNPNRKPFRGSQNKRILNISGADIAHGSSCEVWTLSPSDFQTIQSETRFAALIPDVKNTMRRAVPDGPNNHSVAMWVTVGDIHVLLGADLERTADARAGWESVVASKNRPDGEVSLYKVSHHGSENGHHDGLWASILRTNVNAIVTPWNRSSGLPTADDIKRLTCATENLFLTSAASSLVRARHDHLVERMMREFGIMTKRNPSNVGAVTARFEVGTSSEWTVKNWEMA